MSAFRRPVQGYTFQAGGRPPPFLQRGGHIQGGRGFGSLFAKLGRWIMPLIRKSAPVIKNTLVKAGKEVLHHPELRKAAKSIQENMLAEGAKAAGQAAGRLVKGPEIAEDGSMKPIEPDEASQRINKAVKRKLSSKLSSTNYGPHFLPKNLVLSTKKGKPTTLVTRDRGSKRKINQPPKKQNKQNKKVKKSYKKALF